MSLTKLRNMAIVWVFVVVLCVSLLHEVYIGNEDIVCICAPVFVCLCVCVCVLQGYKEWGHWP